MNDMSEEIREREKRLIEDALLNDNGSPRIKDMESFRQVSRARLKSVFGLRTTSIRWIEKELAKDGRKLAQPTEADKKLRQWDITDEEYIVMRDYIHGIDQNGEKKPLLLGDFLKLTPQQIEEIVELAHEGELRADKLIEQRDDYMYSQEPEK